MKKILVIADTKDFSLSIQNAATNGQSLPEGISLVAHNSWLIDAHTSLPFFASIVNGAAVQKVKLTVCYIDDEVITIPA